jgi:hypothetical protein
MPEERARNADNQQQSAAAGDTSQQFGSGDSDNTQQSQRAPQANESNRAPRPPMDVLRTTGQQLKREGMDLVEDVSGKAQDLAEQQKAKAGGYMQSVSRAVQAGAEALRRDGHGDSAELVDRIADEINEAANALTSRDPRRLLEDVNRLARDNPATFLSLSLLAGFGGARVIKSNMSSTGGQNT